MKPKYLRECQLNCKSLILNSLIVKSKYPRNRTYYPATLIKSKSYKIIKWISRSSRLYRCKVSILLIKWVSCWHKSQISNKTFKFLKCNCSRRIKLFKSFRKRPRIHLLSKKYLKLNLNIKTLLNNSTLQ